MRNDVGPMTLPEIDLARRKILQNARQLLREAKLLCTHRHFARAYTLAHLCCEELARLPMLNRAGLRIAARKPVDWKRLHKRLRDHRLKLRMLESMETALGADAFARWQEVERAARTFNAIKNHSLYADPWRGRFRTPSEVVRDVEAKGMIAIAAARLRYFANAERRNGKLTDVDGWPELPVLIEAMESKFNDSRSGA